MNKTIIKNQIVNDINSLNDSDLKQVFDFIRFIRNKDDIDPTSEIIENDDFYKDIKQGIKEKQEGKLHNWNDIK